MRGLPLLDPKCGKQAKFRIAVGLHQESALSWHLFALVLDELTRYIQKISNDVCCLWMILS